MGPTFFKCFLLLFVKCQEETSVKSWHFTEVSLQEVLDIAQICMHPIYYRLWFIEQAHPSQYSTEWLTIGPAVYASRTSLTNTHVTLSVAL